MNRLVKVISIAVVSAVILSACSNNKKTDETIAGLEEETIVETMSEATNTLTPEPTNATIPTSEPTSEYIEFGRYEQDGDVSNGPEPIEWEVVSEEEGRILLISRFILDCQPYNTEDTEVTWESCSLREWLNNDFYNAAFDESEQNQILTVILSNPDNAEFETEGGNDTEDKVFCLSVEEIFDNYEYDFWDGEYGYFQELVTEVTQYAIDQGVFNELITSEYYTDYWESLGYTEDTVGLNCGSWWLRSPGDNNEYAAYGCYDGSVGWGLFGSALVSEAYGVRPAIYLNVPE